MQQDRSAMLKDLLDRLNTLGISIRMAAPLEWRWLWLAGLDLPPPLFMPWWAATLFLGLPAGLAWVVFMALVQRHTGQGAPLAQNLGAVVTMLLVGGLQAAYLRSRFEQHRLPSWSSVVQRLSTAQPSAVAEPGPHGVSGADWRRVAPPVLVIGLYALSLLLGALPDTPGWFLLLTGWMGMIRGNFAWLANPLFLLAFVKVSMRRPLAAAFCSVMAFAVALQSFVGFNGEGFFPSFHAADLQVGFYVWLAALGIHALWVVRVELDADSQRN